MCVCGGGGRGLEGYWVVKSQRKKNFGLGEIGQEIILVLL